MSNDSSKTNAQFPQTELTNLIVTHVAMRADDLNIHFYTVRVYRKREIAINQFVFSIVEVKI